VAAALHDRNTTIVRIRAIALWSVVVLVATVGVAWYWLLHTESGARWLVARAQAAAQGALQLASVRGDLASGVTATAISFEAGGTGVTAAELTIAVDVDLLPPGLEIVTAALHTVDVRIGPSDQPDDEPRDIESMLRKLALPIPIRVNGMSVDDVVLEAPDFDYTLANVELQGSWHDRIVVDRLLVDGDDLTAVLEGTFDPAADLAHVGKLSVKLKPNLTGRGEDIAITLQSEGSYRRLALAADVANFEASVRGELRHLLHAPEWNLELDVPHYVWPLDDDRRIDFAGVSASSRGRVDDWDLRVAGSVTLTGMPTQDIRFEGSGDGGGFDVTALQVSGQLADLSGTSTIRWAGDRFVGADVVIRRFDPARLTEDWPADHPVSGRLGGRLDNSRLTIRDAELAVDRTGAMLRLKADVDRGTRVVAGSLQWQDLRWPLSGPGAIVRSNAADLTVQGTLDDWQVRGRIEVGAGELPDGSFEVDGGGDRHRAYARIIEGDVLGGKLAGNVEYAWRGARPWQGEVDVDALSIGPLLPEWPGRLSGHLKAQGTASRPWVFRLSDVTGEIRSSPLSASGGLTLTDDDLVADELRIEHGESRVRLDGSLHDAAGLTFEAEVSGVGQYVDAMAGSFTATGMIRLTQDDPRLSLNLESAALGYGDFDAVGLRIEDARTAGEIANLRASAEQLTNGERAVDDLVLLGVLTDERQTLELQAGYSGGSIALEMDGMADDWREPLDTTWRGQVRQLSLALDDEHSVTLVAPANVELSARRVVTDQLCLGNAGSKFCVDGHWDVDGHYGGRALLDRVPVGLAEHLWDIGLRFDQALNGEVVWDVQPGTGPSGRGGLEMSPGSIASVDEPSLTIETGAGSVSFEIVDNQLLSGSLSFPMPGTGEIRGNFLLEDIGMPADSGIRGEFDADVSEIAILSQLVPFVDAASGRLRSQLQFSGTLSTPLLTGNLALEDGSFEYRPLGMLLEDINLDGRMSSDYRVELEGRFRAGQGQGEIHARANYRDIERPGVEVSLRGENLLLVNVPDVRVHVDPDLEIKATSESLAINGTLLVPEARIKPVNLATTRVYESEDVVIVAGELPDRPAEKKASGIRYSGSADVTLGDNIVIDLDLARATVSGTTKFTWRDDPMPLARGRYDVAGTISAFGQVLDITEGSVRFADVPADSPYLRIRAEREIYGNTQVKRAGVLVDGPLKRPTMEGYTQPLTTEERALALLVTGSDFDYEQGVGAIDFGTYIAPRLFVSYGVGVFERENIISARFDLSKGFGIKASSGSKESGVDINYRIDN